jgi:hypothetical protein
MGVMAIDTSEIDIRIVFGEIAFVTPFKAGTHLKSFGMTSHYKGLVSFLTWHVNGKNGVEVHPGSKISELFSGFQHVVSL